MEQQKKPVNGMKVVGLNIGIYAAYCVIMALATGSVLGAYPFLIVHFILCIVLCIALKHLSWLLSAGILLVLGFSTCVAALAMS
ncbi:MAG: hypothetical protein EOP54_30710 [Sphingobacteriales bacterium]|nr:MAG: hypothetical protein EOP54_30710 [Sphingobacteriales bacterium]